MPHRNSQPDVNSGGDWKTWSSKTSLALPGAEEKLDERSVRDRYLVGVLRSSQAGLRSRNQRLKGMRSSRRVLLDQLEEDGAEGEGRPKGTLRTAAEGNLSLIVTA